MKHVNSAMTKTQFSQANKTKRALSAIWGAGLACSLLSAGSVSAGSMSAESQAHTLTVDIDNIQVQTGALMVELYANAEDYAAGHNPSASMIKPVTKTEHRLVFSDLADGQYAVKVFHDENNNHSLDTNMLGVPSEGYGFSNNAGSFGPASFKDASFSLQADAQITIHIR
ncbi:MULTISPECIES: DUF2141 domain-containing protein [Shewanella]|uniref:DUF2141 domain-containing protein n=1 Tax=Shewanella TaxID=22 RepID=UPI001C5B1C5A|nr:MULTISPECIES: DUF2141 domain-containing protein [Shewanella]MBW3514358.1 DUF2141 domain-containing protein [Shewanella sp. NKUCC01_JLK]MCU7985784.1 DUF2141 domain-containing protein [Shewanella sp. SW24]MCU8006752.1 DUF2141 domain-containing protein [Shewanella sp. SM87]MCU8022125.1 DUF2141 domain-containing protein [Shewanella sp. SM78]MCU8030748.1 DUF2141 domain-containing protein [Shewanella sp. SM73]